MEDNKTGLLVGGIIGLVIGGGCYCAYRDAAKFYKRLQGIKHYEVNSELREDLKSVDVRTSYAAVTGKVVADANTIKSKYKDSLEGVMHSLEIKEHKIVWHAGLRRWTDKYHTVSNSWSTEPFSLAGNRTFLKIKVCEPSSLKTCSSLTTTYDHYEPTQKTLAEKFFDTLLSEYVKGIHTIENMLLVGSEATIIGELDSNFGKYRIKPPSGEGLKYIITTSSLEEVKKNEGFKSNAWRLATMAFGILGGTCVLMWFYFHVKRFYSERENEKRRREAYEEFESLENEYRNNANDYNNDDNNEQNVCVICLENQRNAVILPCGHVCGCRRCLLQVRSCPICRGDIDRLVPMFNS